MRRAQGSGPAGARFWWHDRRYHRSGHVFQDRFYSSVVDKESYFHLVSRYIDLNAVHAGLAKNPKDYPWSSYSIYCHYQEECNDNLIDDERFLSYAGTVKNLEKARLEYVKFVQDGINAEELKNPEFIKNKKML